MSAPEQSYPFSSSQPVELEWMRGQRLRDFAPHIRLVKPSPKTDVALDEERCPECCELPPWCGCDWAAIADQALAEVSTRDNGGVAINTRESK